METEYHILFSITLKHSKFGQDPVPGMSITPTESCRAQLSRYGMVFKNNNAGGFVGIEKRKNAEGDIVPFRPWKQTVDFTFLLKSENPGLLTKTAPYHNGQFLSDLSSSYLIYCDNLDPNNAIDLSEELTSDQVLSGNDIFFLTSRKLSVSEVEEIRYTPLYPGGLPARELPEQRGQSPLNITLDAGAYTLTRLFSAASKTDAVMTGLVDDTNGTLGVIRIFKDKDTDYNARQHYTLSMQGIP